MALNLAGGVIAYATMIDGFSKTISKTTVTKTTNPITGEELLTDGTPGNITGAFFRREDSWSQDKEGLFQGADAVLMVKPAVSISKNDKLTYDGETYRLNSVVTRRLNGSAFYIMGRCFKI